MSNDDIRAYFDANTDLMYRDFHKKLVPNIDALRGVRLPIIRDLAKTITRGDYKTYLDTASLNSYEERMLYALVIGSLKGGFETIEPYITRFVPCIDNWAVCDCFCSSLKIASRHPEQMLNYILSYLDSDKEYHVRFGVVMLMSYYAEDKYIDMLLSRFEEIALDDYYVRMAVAWAISVCYVKHCAKTLSFLQQNRLSSWTHNRAIQKIVESKRVSDRDKILVRNFKRS